MASEPPDGPGARLRRIRAAGALSQSDLAGRLGISASYLSLIESGRRPLPPGLRDAAAAELGVAPDALTNGAPDPVAEAAALELELRFAEMVLRTGDPAVAGERFDAALTAARDMGRDDLASVALWGRGRCREGVGDGDGALADLEQLWSLPRLPPDLDRAWLGVTLCRVSYDFGDIDRAIDVGEAALALVSGLGNDEVTFENRIALAVTLAGPYAMRGDLSRAHYLVSTALAEADQAQSPQARGSAYWQAALVSQGRGDLGTARRHVDRAIALYSEGENRQALAALRLVSGWLHLQGATPDLAAAMSQLRVALDDELLSGDLLMRADAETELARAMVLSGQPQQALDLLVRTVGSVSGLDNLRLPAAVAVRGHAELALGLEADARRSLNQAVAQLDAVADSREKAAVWRELAELFAAQGEVDQALNAYRQAADSGGVRAPSAVQTPVASQRC